MKDIAKYCGISAMTVSRVVNNSRHVSEEMKARVNEACKELGYIPNHAAKALIKKETLMVGLIVPDIGDYYADIIKKTTFYLDKHGYGVILCHCDNKKEKEWKYLHFLFEGRVDGIIMFPIDTKNYDYSYINQVVPVVTVNKKAQGLKSSFVGTDNYVGGRMMTEYIIKKGYKRIGVICGELAQRSLADRFTAYKDTIKEYGIPFDEALIFEEKLSFSAGIEGAQYLLKKGVDAIFAFNDSTAMGVMRYCGDNNIKIPSEVGIAGYDNIQQLDFYSLKLTTIDYNASIVGSRAADILMEEISDKNLDKRTQIFNPRLVIGNTL